MGRIVLFLSSSSESIMAFAIPPQNIRLIQRMLEEEIEEEAALVLLLNQRRRRRRRRVRPWIARRPQFGQYHQLMADLEREAQGDFTNFLRMELLMFNELVNRLTPRISKQ